MIGTSLKKAREARGWDQERMARELGVKQGTYSSYEQMAALPSDEVLDRIVAVIPEMSARVAEVRKLRPRRSCFARAGVGAQTTQEAERQHALHKALAKRRHQ